MDTQQLKRQFTNKEFCLFLMIDRFYKSNKCSQDKIKMMIDIIMGTKNITDISLRILDWFVTRYSKAGVFVDNTSDELEDDYTETNVPINVHLSYKGQLKTYKKRYFDPFRRKDKFNYEFIIDGTSVLLFTTIGQLNFFLWAIENNILDYVKNNLEEITTAMNICNKEDKEKRTKGKHKKTNENTSTDISKSNTSNTTLDASDIDDDDEDDNLLML